MSLLDLTFSYETLVARGVLELYPEARVRRWMDDRPRVTVAQALDSPAPPGVVFWAVLREHLVGEQVLHQLAVDIASEVLRRHRAAGVYVDFRSERALAAKQDQLDGRISVGELQVHRGRAVAAAADVGEHDDSRVWALAGVVCQALATEADDAVSMTYYSYLELYPTPGDRDWLLSTVRRRLAEGTPQ